MAEDIANLRIKVDTSQVKNASNDLNKLSGASNKAQSSSQGLNSSFTMLKGTLAALGVSLSVGQFIRLSDSYTKLTAQLRLATKDQAEFNEAYRNVQNIADTAQSSIEETGVLYARLSNALQTLNATQTQVSQITEAVALGLKISGAGAQETAASMLQLSQAFGAGALTGDEFRTINENAPRIMQALADSLGVTRGELKGMAADGKLTSDVIGNALIKSLDKFRSEAEKVQNISGGIQSVSNQFTLMFGEIDKATGASNRLADALKSVADYFKELRTNQRSFAMEGLKFGGFAGLSTGLFLDYMQGDVPAEGRTATGKITRAGESSDGLLKPQAMVKEDVKSASRKIQEESRLARDLADANADLLRSAQSLIPIEQTRSEVMQEMLDSYTGLDPAVRQHIQSKIDEASQYERTQQAIQNERFAYEEAQKAKEEADRERQQNIADMVAYEKEKLEESQRGYRELQNSIEGFSRNATNALVDFTFGAETSFKKMVDAMLRELARLTIQKSIMDPLVEGLSGVFSGGGSGLFSFLTGRASGGNVNAGQPVVVGEAGREVFVPSAAGTVIPNSKAGGQVNNISIVINEGQRQETGQDSSKMAKAIEQAVMGVLLKQKRQGGLLGA